MYVTRTLNLVVVVILMLVGKIEKHFKLCPNKSLEFVKRRIIDSLGIKYEVENEGLVQVFILCWEEWKGPICVKGVELRNSLWKQFYM